MVLATGFGLLLAAAMSLRGHAGWARGLAWGAAGYAVFFVLPSLGLPPELPGAPAAPLHGRQAWWIATVVLSGAGLGLLLLSRATWLRLLGMGMIAAPHLVGAPRPATLGGPPQELVSAFTRAAFLANAVMWLCLGSVVGSLLRRKRLD